MHSALHVNSQNGAGAEDAIAASIECASFVAIVALYNHYTMLQPAVGSLAT